MDQKFSFDLINQLMIKVLIIMCFLCRRQEGGSVPGPGLDTGTGPGSGDPHRVKEESRTQSSKGFVKRYCDEMISDKTSCLMF